MKILYAWEIGEDLGHITQFVPLALELRRRGHEVVTALRELPRAEEVIGRHGITMLQAPIWQGELLDPPQLPVSYAEILFFYGYLDASRLTAMIKAWIGLISLIGPDIMIADHAPTALIAARALGIPRTTMGAGFFLPPATDPLPNMRPWMKVSPERLAQSDQRALRTINTALQTLSARPLDRLSDIFACARHFLITFPELDHYGSRDQAQYYGPILGPRKGVAPQWPKGRGARAFAYLKPHYEHLGEALDALAAFECRVTAFVGAVPKERFAKLQNNAVALSQIPYDIERAASECDFCVCHAGHGTTCELLLKGKPLLMLPTQLEQYLMAKRVSEAGAGLIADRDNPDGGFRAAIKQIIGNANLAKQAREFAKRHQGTTSLSTVTRIANECEAIARQNTAGTAS